MTSSSKTYAPVLMNGINLPVHRSPGTTNDGIAFGRFGSEVIITITCEGEALFVRLVGDNIDIAAHLMARCMTDVARVEHPSLGGVQ